MRRILVPTSFYQQFDADVDVTPPERSLRGWGMATLPLDLDHTAVVVMHAWSTGGYSNYPGWYRASSFLWRAEQILQESFPPFLSAVRKSGIRIIHVLARGAEYASMGPEIREAAALRDHVSSSWPIDEITAELIHFRSDRVHPGSANRDDVRRGLRNLDIAPEARPLAGERVVFTSEELLDACRVHGVGHLIYIGFTINGCILRSPGGMVDMARHGLLCSAVEDCVTALESDSTAAHETAKAMALWEVALMTGFVYTSQDLIAAFAGEGG